MRATETSLGNERAQLPSCASADAPLIAFDWAATPLGPPENWSDELRAAILKVLPSESAPAIHSASGNDDGNAVSSGNGDGMNAQPDSAHGYPRANAPVQPAATPNVRQLADHLAGVTRLFELSRRLAQATDLTAALQDIMATAVQLTPASKGCIHLSDAATGTLELAVQQGFERAANALWETGDWPGSGEIAGGALIIDDVRTHPELQGTAHLEWLVREGVLAIHSTPLVTGTEKPVGILTIHFSKPYRLPDDVLRLLELLACLAADAIARIRADTALRESEARLRNALQIETVGVVFFRNDGLITDVNEAFLRMSGYRRSDLVAGRLRCEEITPPEGRGQARRAAAEFAALGRITPRETECLRRDRTRWRALYAAARIKQDDGVAFIIDISESHPAEQELRRYRDNLELLVQERTAELDAVNGALRDEIVERHRAEAGRQVLLKLLVSAQEAERSRISRELHDEVGQLVTALMLGLKTLESAPGADTNAATLKALHGITEQIGKEVHQLALELRPSALDDLGLLRTLTNYVDDWSARTGIAVDVHTSGFVSDRLPVPVETTLYRIAQEALNNVLKHAHARRVSLIFERRADQAIMILEDDGCGFDADALRPRATEKRLGLLGMEERAALADGELNIESKPGRGTTIFVRVPAPLLAKTKPHE